MKTTVRLRLYWHDFYYRVMPRSAILFAMNCQDATEHIDLGAKPKSIKSKVRHLVHFSFCQACRDYRSFSNLLTRVIRKQHPHSSAKSIDLDALNAKLLQLYGSRK